MYDFFVGHFWTIFASLGTLGIIALVVCFFVFGWQMVAVLNVF